MEKLNLKPTHKPVQNYYEALSQFKTIGVSHEGAVRSAFQTLLEHCGRQFGWKLVPEWPIKRDRAHSLRVDGALVDEFRLTHGFWEAKDSHDDLGREVKKKLTAGYPQNNIIFQAPERAILWQNGRSVLDVDITEPVALVEIVKQFFDYTPPEFEEWTDAVTHFQNQVPELGRALAELIKDEEKSNPRFRAAFDDFLALCRQSINPNLSAQAVEEMLIQHLLTERIFRTVFNNPDFTRRNVIASEIEKVIDALTSQSFSRDGFLQSLDRFYKAIDSTAKTIDDFSQKQEFLNTVYEKFFQGFSVKVADTHGIVYTPQPIVKFMVRSVEDILQKEFGKSLSSPDVHILDPFVGTGNFIVHIMQAIKKTALAKKYHDELHCNEVMLLPYYIASMNIEHEFYELTGGYESFQGICLVDTFELAEAKQRELSYMTAENTARVERQKASPINVIIGNPPYNVGQINENDNNKNRKYKTIDRRVSETYARDSQASSVSKLNNPYVKAIRWASDRIGTDGIVAFIAISGFVQKKAFDGMRKHLAIDFDKLYILDLGGDTKTNPKLSGTTHNVFGIPDGVSINLFIRKNGRAKLAEPRPTIYYSRVDEFWRKEQKLKYLREVENVSQIEWELLQPDEDHTWLTKGLQQDYGTLLPLGNKETKQRQVEPSALFSNYSIGVNTNRDDWAYNFGASDLSSNIDRLINTYNSEVHRWLSRPKKHRDDLDDFVLSDDKRIKWSSRLKESLLRGLLVTYSEHSVRLALYRPFTSRYLYFDEILNQRRGQFPRIFPAAESDNLLICIGGYGRKAFSVLLSNKIADLNFYGDPQQSFPFYTYSEDGTNRRENVTDWALEQFRAHYKDKSITKWDIFHYVYALLHHPLYRERYAANLKRELPRIPLAPDFLAFANIGKRLAEIHVNYEQQPEFPLERIEKPGAQLDWRVERMKLSKDKRSLIYNDFLTLSGIPPEVFEYRLGNRSALDWIIDQYQVSTDKRSGITNDPNRADDPQYIVRLIGEVVTVSLETVALTQQLGGLVCADK
jgi:predicted helicase